MADNRIFQAHGRILETITLIESLVPPPVATADTQVPLDSPHGAAAQGDTATRSAATNSAAPPLAQPSAIVRPIKLSSASVDATPDLAPDDLRRIRGIDRTIAAALVALGVRRFAQIAKWTAADVVSVRAALGLGTAIARQNWIEQAAMLAPVAVPNAMMESAPVPELFRDSGPGPTPDPGQNSSPILPNVTSTEAEHAAPHDGAADDLADIATLTSADIDLLQRHSITSFAALANLNAQSARALADRVDDQQRLYREAWIDQAALLQTGSQTLFAATRHGGFSAALVSKRALWPTVSAPQTDPEPHARVSTEVLLDQSPPPLPPVVGHAGLADRNPPPQALQLPAPARHRTAANDIGEGPAVAAHRLVDGNDEPIAHPANRTTVATDLPAIFAPPSPSEAPLLMPLGASPLTTTPEAFADPVNDLPDAFAEEADVEIITTEAGGLFPISDRLAAGSGVRSDDVVWFATGQEDDSADCVIVTYGRVEPHQFVGGGATLAQAMQRQATSRPDTQANAAEAVPMRQRSDFAGERPHDYAAYHGEVEEAAVEIILPDAVPTRADALEDVSPASMIACTRTGAGGSIRQAISDEGFDDQPIDPTALPQPSSPVRRFMKALTG